MDLGRFHRAIEQLASAYKKANLPPLFDQLISDLSAVASSPTNQNAADAYRTRLEQLRQLLYAHDQEVKVGPTAEVITALGLDDIVGIGLFEKTKRTVADNHLSPALAAQALSILKSEVETKYRHIIATDDAFSSLEVEYEELDDGESEISLSLPIQRDERTLSDLAQEAKDWNQIIATLSEVFDPDRPQAKIRTLASGSWLIYLASTPLVLFGIAKTIRGVNQILSEALQTKELIKKLSAVKAPTKEVEDHQQNKLNNDLEALATDLVQTNYKRTDEGRKNELITATTIALKQLTKKIAAGSRVNLRLASQKRPKIADETSPTPEEKQQLKDAQSFEELKEKVDAEVSQISYFDDASELMNMLPPP